MERAVREYLAAHPGRVDVRELLRALVPVVTRATARPVAHKRGASAGLTGARASTAATGVLADMARAGVVQWHNPEARAGRTTASVELPRSNPRGRRRARTPRKVKRELTGAGVALLDHRLGTAILHAGRAVSNATKRRNPPLPVRTFTGKSGHLVSEHVLAIDYRHAASVQRTPYRHDFGGNVELWALRDGSLLLRGGHGQRLWEDFFVRDSE